MAARADVPRFSMHTTRHLCLTDLARMGWELHAIATFAGHRSTESTMSYLSQMTQLAFHNFTSAAVGMAIAVALVRGIARRSGGRSGQPLM